MGKKRTASLRGRRRASLALRVKKTIKTALLAAGIDVRKARSVGGYGAFEDQRRILDSHLAGAEDPTIVDAGAHVGEVTARYRELFPRARIHSFEPATRGFEQLAQRFAGDDRTFAYNAALDERSGKVKLHVNRDEVTNSLLASLDAVDDSELADRMATIRPVDVSSTTLDDWCRDQGVDRIHVLKMDVQGAELRVLRGAERQLAEQKIWLIYSEVNFARFYEGQAFFWDVAGLLAGHGFELFNLYNCKTARRGQLAWGDAIFLGPRLLQPAGSASV